MANGVEHLSFAYNSLFKFNSIGFALAKCEFVTLNNRSSFAQLIDFLSF